MISVLLKIGGNFSITSPKNPQYGTRRIRAAIFKDWRYVSNYYEYSINKIKNKIEVNDESNGIKSNDILV